MEIVLTSHGGWEKKVRVMGICDGWAFVWWPGCGAYDLSLETGGLMQPGVCMSRDPHEWKASDEDLAELRKLKPGPI